MSDLQKGQLIYGASWGTSPNKSHAYRATRPECLKAFLVSNARKCQVSANECGEIHGESITLIFNLRDRNRVPDFREEFTRKQAKEALDTGRFASDVPTMLPERQNAA